MTRTQLVMANWKQQGSEQALKHWLSEVSVPDLTAISRVLCVPLPYLATLRGDDQTVAAAKIKAKKLF